MILPLMNYLPNYLLYGLYSNTSVNIVSFSAIFKITLVFLVVPLTTGINFGVNTFLDKFSVSTIILRNH